MGQQYLIVQHSEHQVAQTPQVLSSQVSHTVWQVRALQVLHAVMQWLIKVQIVPDPPFAPLASSVPRGDRLVTVILLSSNFFGFGFFIISS